MPLPRACRLPALLALLGLAGCESSPFAGRLETYVVRLARTLEQPVPAPVEAAQVALPVAADLTLPAPDSRINILEFLRTYGCELHQAIAERNSSLGRFADAGNRLAYELAFLRLAPACSARLRKDAPALAARLDAETTAKREALPAALWNLVIAGEHYHSYWRVSAQLGNFPAVLDSHAEGALRYQLAIVTDVLGGRESGFDYSAYLAAVQPLGAGEGGAMLRSWHLLTIQLRRATEVLERRAAAQPVCYPGMVTAEARVFRNVVMEFFVSGIQADVARLNRQYYAHEAVFSRLETLLGPVSTDPYEAFRHERDALVAAARAEVVRHTRALQPLLAQCGFLPSASG